MRSRTPALTAFAFSALAVAAGCGTSDHRQPQTKPQPQTQAKSPAAESSSEGVLGNKVGNLAPPVVGKTWFSPSGKPPDLKGRVYLADFWFSTCGTCLEGIPALKATAKKYADKGLVVIAPTPDTEDDVRKFKETHPIDEYAMLSDAEKTAEAFGMEEFPMLFLVGKDGKILWKKQHIDESLDAVIEAALAAQ